MSVLLDTNACIAIFNGHPHIVRQRMESFVARRGSVSLSAIVVFELRYGIAKSEQVERNTRRLELFLTTARVLPFDSDDAHIAGDIRCELERIGQPIGAYDYLIAAQALHHDLTLVTGNVREFSRVKGLRWENWAV